VVTILDFADNRRHLIHNHREPSGIGTLFALEEFSIVENTLSVFQRQSAILPPPFVTAFQPATSVLFKTPERWIGMLLRITTQAKILPANSQFKIRFNLHLI
jgi:hypothetical protein